MAWSPLRRANAGISWVRKPGDYANLFPPLPGRHHLGLGDALLLEDALLEAIGAHPMLMNRPLVISPKGVRLCRPSEKVLDFLPPQRGQFIQLFSPHRDRHFLNALEETAGRKGLLRPASCVNGPVWGVDWQRKFSVPIVCRRRPLQTLQPWLRTG
jgi:hypothetical protein